MKRSAGIAVACFFVLCISPVPSAAAGPGQDLDVPTLDRLIIEWKADLAKLMEELSDPETIYVRLPGGSFIPVKEDVVMKAITADFIEQLREAAASNKKVAFNVALQEVQRVKEALAANRKVVYAKLVEQDKVLRADEELRAQFIRDIIRWLEESRAAAQGQGKAPGAGGPAQPTEDLDSAKARLIADLDVVRKRENWDVRDHGVVKVRFEGARTTARLNQVLALQKDYSGCYQDWNAENARIAAAAKAGRYRIPGDRIAESSRALKEREDCLKAALARYEKAIF